MTSNVLFRSLPVNFIPISLVLLTDWSPLTVVSQCEHIVITPQCEHIVITQ